ncbi:MAG TPA: phosphotransferase, partial [Chloroflexota bacterium]
AHVLGEKITRPRPTDLKQVPPGAHALTREWLTAALCEDCPGAEVTQIFVGHANEGTTSRRAIIVDYNATGRDAGLPTRIFCKSSATFLSRLVTGLSGAAAAEVGFYNDVRPLLNVEAADCYQAGSHPRSKRATLILEDVAATRGVSWPDPRDTYVDRPLAESMVDMMATYHGTLWNDRRLSQWSWLPTAEQFQIGVNETIDFEKRSMVGVERSEAFVPAEFAARRSEIYPCLMRSLELHRDRPQTFLHQDVHLRNWYMTADRRMGLFDWQCCARGLWALDFAYAMMGALTVEDRRAWERELLVRYLEQLAAAGGEAPSFDQAWLDYRQQVFHGLIFWLYTIGAGKLQPEMQPLKVSEANVERMAHAVIDLESFDAFGGSHV